MLHGSFWNSIQMKFIWLQVRKALQVKSFNFERAFTVSFSLVNSVAKWFIIPRVRIKLLNMNFKSQKKLGTSENLSWLTKSSYFRLIDFTLAYYIRCNHFSQNIIQREKCPWTLEECLSPTIVPIHAYLLFGVVVDFVSRFFIIHENHRKKICQLMFAHCPFFWMLSTKTSCRIVRGNGSVVNQFQA